MKQVEAILKPRTIKFDNLHKERTLKSGNITRRAAWIVNHAEHKRYTGFLEEVYLCRLKNQQVVVRSIPDKAQQYDQFCRYAATILYTNC